MAAEPTGSRWAAVLGHPIAHSLSPTLHRAAYAALGLPWRYEAMDTDVPALAGALRRARSDPDFAGYSLTMPLKAAAVPLLDLVETEVGVVNTVVPVNGQLVGHNTDVDGIRDAVRGLAVEAGPALVLGAGGTARAAVVALQALGRAVTVASRRPLGPGAGPDVHRVDFGAARPQNFAVVVATTPAGATDELARTPWPARVGLVDVVYAPWPTALAAVARAAGAPVAGGREVLLGQALQQVRLMTGRAAPVEAMRAALG